MMHSLFFSSYVLPRGSLSWSSADYEEQLSTLVASIGSCVCKLISIISDTLYSVTDSSQTSVVNNGLGRHFVLLATAEKLAFDKVSLSTELSNTPESISSIYLYRF